MRTTILTVLTLAALFAWSSDLMAASVPPPPDSTGADTSSWHVDTDRRLSIGFLTGLWIPNGNTATLGNKFQIGIFMGGRVHGWGADLQVAFRLGRASSHYMVSYDGEFVSTDYFLGAQILLLASRRIIRSGSYEAELQVGLGIDGFDAIDSKESPKTIISLGNSIGVTQYFFAPSDFAHVALQTQFSFVSYDTGGGTDLSGNTISINLIFGLGGQPVH